MNGPDPNHAVIRAGTPADLSAIGRLGALLVRTHHDFDPQRFMPPSAATERGYSWFIETQLQEPDVVILVAERADQVVGYSYAAIEGRDYQSLRGPAGVLHDIVVDPGHRGLGIGRMLLDATLTVLQDLGAPRVVLMTATANAVARTLFAQAGFRPTMIEMTRESGVAPQAAE